MFLRKATLVLIITIVVSFSIRTFGTLFPQIFKSILIAQATVLINTVFILSHLVFWITFYREYISEKKPSLKTICIFAISGSFAVSAIYLKKCSFVFGAGPHILMFLLNPYYNALAPLISSSIHLVFFVSLKRSLEMDELPRLGRPVFSIIVGNGIFICLHLIVLFNFISRDRFEWLEHMPRVISVGTVPVILLAVCFMLYFYYHFYRYLTSMGNIEKISKLQS